MKKYLELNARLNLLGPNGEIQTDQDKEAAREFFVGPGGVNENTVFFHTLEEKLDYLFENGYYDKSVFDQYTPEFVKDLYKRVYSFKFRFPTFVGAYKFYTQYALKTHDGTRYLERFEDRVVATALTLAEGDEGLAAVIADDIIRGVYQPATPTFLNAARADSGEMVSCFLLRIEDNMESIGRAINSSLQLSKRGGGVALLLTNIRESGAPIKEVEGASSGIIPVMKLLEDSFSYANQLGARQGAGAVYLNAHHPDILKFLDTKRENADEKIRIKTLSLGVVIPDITFELARRNEPMYLFSPYDVERVYGVPFSDISVTEKYYEMVEDDRIHKTKIDARRLFQTIAEIQFESGYPYLMFEDNANRANPYKGRINMSNLCVAPETKVLTDKGYEEIQNLAGDYANVWNGEKFSKSFVEKTGEGQSLITIDFDNGASLDVTEYHKFYVKTGYGNCKVEEVRAADLKPGDTLEKFDLPVVDNPNAEEFPHAYTAGLHTAEGTYGQNGQPLLRLYPGKTHLGEFIDYKSSSLKPDSTGRVSYVLPASVPQKYEVPTAYSLNSRLEWLAGLIDGDGWGNGKVGIQIGSIHPEFLEEVRLLLTTLGVESRWSKVKDECLTQFKPGQKHYPTNAMYRLVICGTEAQKLRRMGLPTHRVEIEEYEHQREARGYIRVTSVINEGRVDDTYCLNEPELHKVVFNGIRTGQCSEILQPNEPSILDDDLSYLHTGKDISCNLGSLNIEKVMGSNLPIWLHVSTAVRALTGVVNRTSIDSVPSIRRANDENRSIGLGQMNLHGFLAQNHIEYGSEEALDFVEAYYSKVRYSALMESSRMAIEHGAFDGFEESGYADGTALSHYLENDYTPKTDKVKKLFEGNQVPTPSDWAQLAENIKETGLYHTHLLATPPTGSISYVNGATPSIHPVTAPVEIRKEGKMGRVYYPAPGLSKDTLPYYEDAYSVGYERLIDTYAAATPHVDQGLSCTLFVPDTFTTRDLNRAYIYAWRKGLKTLYYLRIRQEALAGTEIEGCVSCTL